MKNNKGFTLIELLAVILILGIIALIAIPTVNSVIEQSRKGAAESSAKQFITSLEEKAVISEINGVILADGDYSVEIINDRIQLDLKGTRPDDGYVTLQNNNVVYCNLRYGDYIISCDDNRVGNNVNNGNEQETNSEAKMEVEKFASTSWKSSSNSTYIAKVYYNPVTGSRCTENDFNSNLDSYSNSLKDSNNNKAQNGLKTGCMVWYAYKDNGNGTVNMILNHNTSMGVTWASSVSSTTMDTINSRLQSDTTGWKDTARIISAEELFDIIGATKAGLSLNSVVDVNLDDNALSKVGIANFDKSKVSGFNIEQIDNSYNIDPTRYSWLFENLYQNDDEDNMQEIRYSSSVYDRNKYSNYNCYGFWTSNNVTNTNVAKNKEFAWSLGVSSYLYNGIYLSQVSRTTIGIASKSSRSLGIRPVITVSKDVFK